MPGLRREEVASLAGVSVEYYKRLERGNVSGASEASSTPSPTRCSSTTPSARTSSTSPARRALPPARRRAGPAARPPGGAADARLHRRRRRPSATRAATTWPPTPLGRALYAPLFDSREQPPNSARFTFLDPAAQEFFVDWEKAAKDLVAHLRSQAGRNPYDRELSDLVGELSTRSEPFRNWWAAHNVRYHQTGTKRLRHPIVGELELSYEVMELTADSGLRLASSVRSPGAVPPRPSTSWRAGSRRLLIPGAPSVRQGDRGSKTHPIRAAAVLTG